MASYDDEDKARTKRGPNEGEAYDPYGVVYENAGGPKEPPGAYEIAPSGRYVPTGEAKGDQRAQAKSSPPPLTGLAGADGGMAQTGRGKGPGGFDAAGVRGQFTPQGLNDPNLMDRPGMGKPAPQAALRPRPLIPPEFTQADTLRLQELDQSVAKVTADFEDGNITQGLYDKMMAQLNPKRQPLQAKKQAFQQQQQQQAQQQLMQQTALQEMMETQHAVAGAKRFHETVTRITDPMTGQTVTFFQPERGKFEQVNFGESAQVAEAQYADPDAAPEEIQVPLPSDEGSSVATPVARPEQPMPQGQGPQGMGGVAGQGPLFGGPEDRQFGAPPAAPQEVQVPMPEPSGRVIVPPVGVRRDTVPSSLPPTPQQVQQQRMMQQRAIAMQRSQQLAQQGMVEVPGLGVLPTNVMAAAERQAQQQFPNPTPPRGGFRSKEQFRAFQQMAMRQNANRAGLVRQIAGRFMQNEQQNKMRGQMVDEAKRKEQVQAEKDRLAADEKKADRRRTDWFNALKEASNQLSQPGKPPPSYDAIRDRAKDIMRDLDGDGVPDAQQGGGTKAAPEPAKGMTQSQQINRSNYYMSMADRDRRRMIAKNEALPPHLQSPDAMRKWADQMVADEQAVKTAPGEASTKVLGPGPITRKDLGGGASVVSMAPPDTGGAKGAPKDYAGTVSGTGFMGPPDPSVSQPVADMTPEARATQTAEVKARLEAIKKEKVKQGEPKTEEEWLALPPSKKIELLKRYKESGQPLPWYARDWTVQ